MRKVKPNIFLVGVAELLSEGHSVKVRIDGMSMFPFIRGGEDEVELVPYKRNTVIPKGSGVFFRWKEQYMVHRLVKCAEGKFYMMGDGNLKQIEVVDEDGILGILQTIYRMDGSSVDCTEEQWRCRGLWWYRLRSIRRFLLPLFRRFCR